MDEKTRELLTVNETAELLRLGRTRTNELLWTGALRSIKVGRRRLVRAQDVQRFLAEHEFSPGEQD